MAPALLTHIHQARDFLGQGASSDSKFPMIAIAGFVVAGVIILVVCLWLVIRLIRKRAQKKRENARGAAFLSVKGLMKEGQFSEKDELPTSKPALPLNGTTFSRSQIGGVVMPSKAVLPSNATREEILAFHTETDTLPRPFHFAMKASSSLGSELNSTSDLLPPPSHSRADSSDRRSWRSSLFALGGGMRSVHSRMSSVGSIASVSTSAGGGAKRKIRQLFAPVLPDELVLSLGESLTVLHSYDDGWCIVGRADGSPFAAAAAASQGSAFGQGRNTEQAEVGAVPAWVFVRPVKGLRAERPMRSSSLGVSIDANAAAGPRSELMSWSNF